MGLEVGARRLVDRLTLRGAKSLGEHVIVKRGVADCLKDAFRRWWPFADFATARTALALLAPPRSLRIGAHRRNDACLALGPTADFGRARLDPDGGDLVQRMDRLPE